MFRLPRPTTRTWVLARASRPSLPRSSSARSSHGSGSWMPPVCVCVCLCVRVRMHVCVCARARACACVTERARARARWLAGRLETGREQPVQGRKWREVNRKPRERSRQRGQVERWQRGKQGGAQRARRKWTAIAGQRREPGSALGVLLAAAEGLGLVMSFLPVSLSASSDRSVPAQRAPPPHRARRCHAPAARTLRWGPAPAHTAGHARWRGGRRYRSR